MRLKEDAQWQIADGERELDKKVAEAEDKLEDARQELLDGEQEIEDARKEIADGWKEIADGKAEIADKRQELADSLTELQDGKQEIEDGLDQLEEKRIEASDMEEGDEKDGYETGLNLAEAQVKAKRPRWNPALPRRIWEAGSWRRRRIP